MTNDDMLKIALSQSAVDCACGPDDFLKPRNIITISKKNPLARKYLPLPFACDLVSYGNNIVASTSEELSGTVARYLGSCSVAHAFETPSIRSLDALLEPFGLGVCFMAEYFLPDLNALRELPCPYEMRLLAGDELSGLYTDSWSNALCKERSELDILAVGAFDGARLAGLAGCSADCESMYQIGVDVLPEYRRRGIASALTSRLALEILSLGKAPFYCAAWCNLKSVRNAIKCGFRPSWVELTARDREYIDRLNNRVM